MIEGIQRNTCTYSRERECQLVMIQPRPCHLHAFQHPLLRSQQFLYHPCACSSFLRHLHWLRRSLRQRCWFWLRDRLWLWCRFALVGAVLWFELGRCVGVKRCERDVMVWYRGAGDKSRKDLHRHMSRKGCCLAAEDCHNHRRMLLACQQGGHGHLCVRSLTKGRGG